MNIEDMYRIFLIDNIRRPTKEQIENGIDNIEPFCYCENESQAGYAADWIGESFIVPPGKTIEEIWLEQLGKSLEEEWAEVARLKEKWDLSYGKKK